MQRCCFGNVRTTLLAFLFFSAATELRADHYTERVKPLLAEKCLACHGPIRSEQGLRLDAAALIRKGSRDNAVVIAGDPGKSLLIQRVTGADAGEQMPPKGEGVALNLEELGILKKWIADGMPGPADETYVASPREHWAYQPIVSPHLQTDERLAEENNPIDRLLSQQHSQLGLVRLAATDRSTWLKRVTLDLTGLPPTIDETRQFLTDDQPDAYDRVVDRLLSQPSYGQRWGRHWMDVWRYSDWDGYKEELRGSQRHIWHWRDWIIQSLNDNKPYDQMIVEMLAGDEVAPTDMNVLRATGFLARNFHRSNRNIWLDATVEHTAKAFLGMTIACARCHDHKFDPISQEEYYQFRAIFEPHEVRTEQLLGQSDVNRAGIPRAFDAKPDSKTFLLVRGNEKQPREDKPLSPAVPGLFDRSLQCSAIELPRMAYQPELTPTAEANAIEAAWQRLEKARAAVEPKLKKLREQAQQAAQTGKPEAIDQQSPDAIDPIEEALLDVRAAEAQLISLRSRYAADHASVANLTGDPFSKLISKAANDEQQANTVAAHAEFRAALRAREASRNSQEKDVKKKEAAITQAEKTVEAKRDAWNKAREASRSVPTSYTPVGKVYPQASTGRRLALARWITDPQNPLTARVAVNQIWMRHFGSPIVEDVSDFGLRSKQPANSRLLDWLASELLNGQWDMKRLHRVIVLSQIYRLSSHSDSEIAARNKSIDPENRFYWRANVRRLDAEEIRDSLLAVADGLDRTVGGPDLSEDDGEKVPRRSVYFRHAYEKQVSMLVTFDGASPSECYRRSPSIVPQQALALANSPMSRELSRKLGNLLHDSSPSASEQQSFIDQLFMTVLCRMPTKAESETCNAFLTDALSGDSVKARRQSLTHALMNHNDFVVAR